MNNTVRLTLSCLALALASFSLTACQAGVEGVPANPGATVAPESETPSSEPTVKAQDSKPTEESDGAISIGEDGIKVPGATVGPEGIDVGGAKVGPDGITVPNISVGPDGVSLPGIKVGPDGIKAPGININSKGIQVGASGVAFKAPKSATKKACTSGVTKISKASTAIYLTGHCTEVRISASNAEMAHPNWGCSWGLNPPVSSRALRV